MHRGRGPTYSKKKSTCNRTRCVDQRVWLGRPGGYTSWIHQRDVAGAQTRDQVGFFHSGHQVFIKGAALRCLLLRHLVFNSFVVQGFGLGFFIEKDGMIFILDLLRHLVIILHTTGDPVSLSVDGFLCALQAGLQLGKLRVARTELGREFI